MIAGAEFSRDRKYRYALWRIWDNGLPAVMFIGLNPSRADEIKPDPTITNIMKITTANGYGGFYMMNLYALVSPHPEALLTEPDPIGANDDWLDKIAEQCQDVCFVWGAFPRALDRSAQIIRKFPRAYCLGKTKNGHPVHPLHLSSDTKMTPYLNWKP